MEENNSTEIINVINSDEHFKQLEEIFGKYFITLEEQEKINKQQLEESSKIEEELENQELTYREELIKEIKVLQDYQKYNTNLVYTGIVIFCLIFCSTLMYKFLKNFI